MDNAMPGPPAASPTKHRAAKYVGVYISIIMFIISFGMGIMVGKAWYVKKQTTNDEGAVVPSKVVDLDRTVNHSDSADFNEFWQVWDKIKTSYVTSSVKDTDLLYGAIQGMVLSLNDPYSLYFPPKAAEEFNNDLSGQLEGIGAEMGVKNDVITVIAPLPDSPAEKAGLHAGDKVLAIDGTSTYGMDINTAVSKIRGKAGTQVKLSISRDGLSKSQDITITRQKISVPSVMFSMKGDIAYVRILQFNEDTASKFSEAVEKVLQNKAKGIILDLRSNPGGYLDAAVSMASEWIKSGIIVSEKGVDGLDNKHETVGQHRLAGIRTIVLVDKGSASASEIVAGALQDTKTATLIGEKTFGKGSVQDYQSFPDGSALKLTVAEWFTPNGKNINKEGITPDIVMNVDWNTESVGQDAVLDKAMQVLTGATSTPAAASSTK